MNRPSKPPVPVFLQRASYRRRRLRDAARLVPFLGVILWAMPLAWHTEQGAAQVGANGLVYMFGVWVVLILLTAALTRSGRGDDTPAYIDPEAP